MGSKGKNGMCHPVTNSGCQFHSIFYFQSLPRLASHAMRIIARFASQDWHAENSRKTSSDAYVSTTRTGRLCVTGPHLHQHTARYWCLPPKTIEKPPPKKLTWLCIAPPGT